MAFTDNNLICNSRQNSQKPKVLVISSLGPKPYLGGIQNVIDEIINSGLRDNYEFAIFDTYNAPDPSRTLNKKISFAFKLIINCIVKIIKVHPDIIHIHFCSKTDFWKHSLCLVISNLLGIFTIFHLHGGSFDQIYNSYGKLPKFFVRFFLKKADVIVALSEYWKNFLRRTVKNAKIIILQNPISVPVCDFSLNENTYEPLPKTIVLLGSLGKRKGHYDVIKAIPAVLEKHKDAHFYFAGVDEDTDATEKLKMQVKETKIEKSVNFLGAVTGDAKSQLLVDATIVILPSYGENLPISILEGMAYGKPVISTKVGAIPEVIEDNVSGIIISPGDWNALSESINRLLGDEKLRLALGKNAHMRVRGKWDIKKIKVEYDQTYSEILKHRKRKKYFFSK